MVRTKLILTIIATVVALGGTGLWFLISERQTAQERREKFFGSAKEHPTSGGEKMKIEW
ncbi:entry exclusion protein TrbK [Rhizobium sp. Root149]|uniref:entry exclusion protein TrbK n=1 Tax=Rhizobium sp. Root149 TaxID=1736473 RepID=UPI000713D9DD|nr:entry exclusion protein TrbK [Rhizobium sp. Root149]KQZ59800.1 entry exclusion protein TrbK [Rhizobium sp. Root149]